MSHTVLGSDFEGLVGIDPESPFPENIEANLLSILESGGILAGPPPDSRFIGPFTSRQDPRLPEQFRIESGGLKQGTDTTSPGVPGAPFSVPNPNFHLADPISPGVEEDPFLGRRERIRQRTLLGSP